MKHRNHGDNERIIKGDRRKNNFLLRLFTRDPEQAESKVFQSRPLKIGTPNIRGMLATASA
jgi:hypothetical protein